MERIRTGLTSYLSSGDFTPDFIDDVNMMISKIYASWTLYEDEDEFNASCWTKIVSSLKIYNRDGNLSTYLYQVIFNEAQRIHSKHKRMSCDDIDELPGRNPVLFQVSAREDDLMVRDRVHEFACMAYEMGVFVNQKELYRNYLLSNLTPAVKAFMWSFILGPDG